MLRLQLHGVCLGLLRLALGLLDLDEMLKCFSRKSSGLSWRSTRVKFPWRLLATDAFYGRSNTTRVKPSIIIVSTTVNIIIVATTVNIIIVSTTVKTPSSFIGRLTH